MRAAVLALVVAAGLLPAAGCRAEPVAGAGAQRTSREVPRPPVVVDYRRSGQVPYWKAPSKPGRRRRWTPEEIVGLLREYPGYFVDMGIWTNREVGRVVNEAQALAREQGVDASRLLFHYRNDVFVKMSPGWPSCGRDCGWAGILEESDPFDPSWVVTVPRSEHRWALEHRWGDVSKDPFRRDAEHSWPRWIDREAITALNTPERVVALYGAVDDTDPSLAGFDPEFRVSGVVMDLRNPAYRAWSVRRLVANLRLMGIEPGEPAVVLYAYKPGWHAYWDGGRQPGQGCFVPDGRAWTGPAGPCGVPRRWDGGPFHRTTYGPGEFRTALNAMLREMRAGLVAAGHERIRIMTVERPAHGRKWSLLDPDVRSAPWLIGEEGETCDRRDLSERPHPVRCRSRRP